MKLKRFEGNPILKPNPNNEWESLCVCNPGVWYQDGKFYLLYRAAGDDAEHRITLGLATSEDGFHFKQESDRPVLAPTEGSFDGGCIEDPRIVCYDGIYYVTYACRAFCPGRYWENKDRKEPVYKGGEIWGFPNNTTVTALAATKDFRSYLKMGRMTDSSYDDRDVILFPEKINEKYVRLSRAKEWRGEEFGCEHPSIWLSYSDNLLEWPGVNGSYLLAKGEEPWELKVGGSAPPIKTDKGWFMLYHGVDKGGIYRVGAMMLDLFEPHRVIARTKLPILEPELDYELQGIYNGCVFPTGNVVVNGILYVYYGSADKYCCVATADFDKLVSHVSEGK